MPKQPQVDETKTSYKVLLIGSGGREHAIAWKLTQSPKVTRIFVAPGNAGILTLEKVTLADLDNIEDFKVVAGWCVTHKIDMVIIGPENPLSLGIVDELNKHDIPCFGPRRAAAQIEASKHFAKAFMERHHIPTAQWKSFTRPSDAKTFIEFAPFNALVVKASGLAAGKGVIVASTVKEACNAVDSISGSFGEASETIVVEEVLEGEEVSVLAFTDGNSVSVMTPAQDHKRLKDGDNGPNTGGMGAYCPCPLLSATDLEIVTEKILKKTVVGLKAEGVKYCGVLYAGLMITKEGPKVLEFNCRFGDPETQVILPLMESDLFDIFTACVNGTLDEHYINWLPNTYTVGVVMASAGYPGSYAKGKVISNLDTVVKQPGHLVFHAGTKLNNDNKIVTSGGRVLIVVALGHELAIAAAKALQAASTIHFEGAQYRTDIAQKGVARALLMRGQMTYRGSGVDIEAGDTFVTSIKALVNSTKRPGWVNGIGDFGAFFDPKGAGYKDPLLVSGTDGVGTKLIIAEAIDFPDEIGIDLVAMCVNDILAHAAEPLYFLDYYASGRLQQETAERVLCGIAKGCQQAGCALNGGETAEMPGVYHGNTYDLAGFAVGAVERGKQLPLLDKIADGDIVIGLSSSGAHSNGYSLIRKIVKKNDLNYSDPSPFSENQTLGRALLTPTKIYVKSVLGALRSGYVKAFAHITGGGLIENIPRCLPKQLGVELDANNWPIPGIFPWIAAAGGVNEMEMLKTFNCGLGAILIVGPADLQNALSKITDENARVVGKVKSLFGDSPRVEVKNFVNAMTPQMQPHMERVSLRTKRRVGVLISGSGTNLQAIIDHVNDPTIGSLADIAVVISNKEGVEGLKRAELAGIPTKVVSHKNFSSREKFDLELLRLLKEANVEFVVLAGFMRILTPVFVNSYRGKLINIHPALLPSFKGTHAHKQALDAGVRVTGCTVHFVEAEVDAGPIILQETVPILVGDTVEILEARVKATEHKAYPEALELLVRNKVKLGDNGNIVWNL